MLNQFIKNAERRFVFCGTSSPLSGAKYGSAREHFLFYKIPFIYYFLCFLLFLCFDFLSFNGFLRSEGR